MTNALLSESTAIGSSEGDRLLDDVGKLCLDAADREYEARDSASSGGSVGIVTGEGSSAEVLRVRWCEKDGEVGELCGERRRAKDEIGVQDAAAMFSCCRSDPRRTLSSGCLGKPDFFILLLDDRREDDTEWV